MKQLDFDRAFPQTPDCIHAAIEMGFRKGQKQMKMRNKIITLGSIAAALAIMFAAALATGGLNLTPKPDVLAQPPVTDVPKNEEAIHVYSTEGAAYYHLIQDCSGTENAMEMSEIEAVRMGKKACPVCIPMTCNGHNGEEIEYVYYSQGAKYFHKQEECGGSFDLKGEYFTVTRAFPGKEPCTTCFPNGIEECVHERAFVVEIEPTLAPAPEEYTGVNESTTDSILVAEEHIPPNKKEESSVITLTTVYTEYGNPQASYHRFKTCNGQEYRREITESQAIHEKLPECSSCYFGFVYYTDTGTYYHSDPHCNGMMNADMYNRRDAYASGKLPCPTCLLVYCNEDGLYFHLLPDCMGMLFADLHYLADAYAMDNSRCPLCLSPATVYATKTGKYFHAEEHCSGMMNANATNPKTEWQNGKSACTTCIIWDSTWTLKNTAQKLSSEGVHLPEHHDLFVKAFGKSINDLLPGYSFSFESVHMGATENNYSRGWMVKSDADPNKEAFPVVIEFEPGMGGYNGYLLVVNLSDNLKGEGGNNAHEFLKDAFFQKNGMQVSLRNLCNYSQLFFNDEIKSLKSEENRFSVSGVKVYFDANEEVYGYDVRYLYNETDPYILRTKIDKDGKLFWELLKNKTWII